jgi:raffinose/stachyose/melibiose transport system permease protein
LPSENEENRGERRSRRLPWLPPACFEGDLGMNRRAYQTVKDNLFFLVLIGLPLAIYGIFFLYPNLNTFYLSFFNWSGFGERTNVGLKNFYDLLVRSNAFRIALKNTFIYTIVVTLFQNIFGLMLAMGVVKPGVINNALRTIYFMPSIFSSVAVGFIWTFIYDPNVGVINTLLRNVNLEIFAQVWLGDSRIAIFSIAFVHVWVGTGFSMILFVAGLQQIPAELYEAAAIEGANPLNIFWRITLPLLRPTVLTLVVLCTIGSFKAFDYVYILTGGGALGGKAEVLATLIYKEGFLHNRLGYSSALAVILLGVVGLISLTQMYLLRERK